MDKEVWVVSFMDLSKERPETTVLGVFDSLALARGAILGYCVDDHEQLVKYENDGGWREDYYTNLGIYRTEQMIINEVY